MILNVTGVVIKEYVVGESDKYITLFTKELGKIQVGAPRAKKYDKGLASGTQLFVYGEFVLTSYKDTYKLISVEMIHMFHNLREDLLTLSYATYLMEFITQTCEVEESNADLLMLLIRGLLVLEKRKDPSLVRRVFELRALCTLGFMPELLACTQCEKVLENFESSWDLVISEGGLVCPKCQKKGKVHQLTPDLLYTLKYIAYVPIKKVYAFTLDAMLLEQLGLVCDDFISYYIDKRFKTLEFIDSLEKI